MICKFFNGDESKVKISQIIWQWKKFNLKNKEIFDKKKSLIVKLMILSSEIIYLKKMMNCKITYVNVTKFIFT